MKYLMLILGLTCALLFTTSVSERGEFHNQVVSFSGDDGNTRPQLSKQPRWMEYR